MSGLYGGADGTTQQMAAMQGGGGLSGADMAMMDASMMGMGGINMDDSLPMDLDTFGDFTSVDGMGGMTVQGGGVTQLQQGSGVSRSEHGSQDLTGSMNMGGNGANMGGMMSAPAATPAQTAAQQQAQNDPQGTQTGAGAGPLPTGFGVTPQPNTSTLTEFTKRRNWSQRIIEELKDFLHILTPDGRILYVSPSCRGITGYEPHTLIGKFIGEYVHPDDSGIFMREFNESIASGNGLRFFYRFKKEDGTYMIFECDGHPHISSEPSGTGMGMSSTQSPSSVGGLPATGVCRGFFMMARPYPTKNAALLDSFLEHKIENERLMKRIDELKHEEVEENAEQDRLYREQTVQHTPQPGGVATPAETPNSRTMQQELQSEPAGTQSMSGQTPNYQGMPPPAKPSISNTALTRQNLDSALSAQKPDSIADKMSRYEASSTHLEGIELLTGLRYRDGERSHGISTGDTSPALIRGDAGIAILLDRDRDGSKKEKKKLKVADEYVCADCGTLDSPEWRKGPKGPKTLCNACGLRWAKKEKKRGGDGETKKDSPSGTGGGNGSHPPGLQHQASSGGASAGVGSMQSVQSISMGGSGNGGGGGGLTSAGLPPGLPMNQSTGSS